MTTVDEARKALLNARARSIGGEGPPPQFVVDAIDRLIATVRAEYAERDAEAERELADYDERLRAAEAKLATLREAAERRGYTFTIVGGAWDLTPLAATPEDRREPLDDVCSPYYERGWKAGRDALREGER